MATEQRFEDLLTPDALAALTRSTWTWDDRAVRRDLAALLVDLDAARAAAVTGDTAGHADALRARALVSGASFIAVVLGANLIADTGNRLRHQFVAHALNRGDFARAASSALRDVRAHAVAYLAEAAGVDYPPESSWLPLLSTAGQDGLGKAMRAYGHGLSASAFFGNGGLAWQTLGVVGDDSDSATSYIKALEAGQISCTLAVAEQGGSWDPALVRTKATRINGGWQLSGVKELVPAADDADVFFVVARSVAGPSLFAVDAGAPGLTLAAHDVIDETRPLHQLQLTDTPATLLGNEGGGGRLMMSAIDSATTALAAEQVGLIEKSMAIFAAASPPEDAATEVALQHTAALSLWRRATRELSAHSTDAPSAAAAAHIGCSSAAINVATAVAEFVGPSADTDAILRRAMSGSLLFGGPALSHERLLERLGV
jgi:hypothetical protein